MGKDKLRKFRENETFRCMVQPATSEVLGCNHPLKGNWGRDFFGNDNPIILELGCGKGDYTVDLAERNPSFNYIGIDIKGARLWKGLCRSGRLGGKPDPKDRFLGLLAEAVLLLRDRAEALHGAAFTGKAM